MSGGPVVGRHLLAADLRRHRLAAGRTIDDVARHLECSPAKVSRMETGAVKVGAQDLRAVLELYDLSDTERDALFALVRESRTRGWWQQFGDVVPPGSARFYGLEDGASTIGQHTASLVPGLMQTRAYARALIGSVRGLPQELVERRVELRMRRQQLLDRARPPRLDVVLDEAVLWRSIGGPAVMAEQLLRLVELAERPSVTVRVLEFSRGAHPAAGVSFTVFGFGEPPAERVVFREQLDANSFLDEPDQVALYTAALDEAGRAAADPDRSHELLSARLAAL
jgi:transcriptional regulator with XRE-family HTH domain